MVSAWETRLAWAVRSWDAEVENARRLGVRVNVVLTVALAFAGAGSKVLADALLDHSSGGLAVALLCGAVSGVGCIFVGFVRVLTKRERPLRPPTASAHLLPLEEVGDAPLVGSGDRTGAHGDERTLFQAFLATTAAAYELHGRNAEERKRLAVAQQWLVVGAALTLLCGGLYTWHRPADRTAGGSKRASLTEGEGR